MRWPFSRLSNSVTIRFVVKRILQAIPVLWGVTFVTFTLLSILPGGAADSILGADATKAQVAALTKQLGLDRPFVLRYLDWLKDALSGHLGTSLATGQPISTVVGERLPVSLELILLAFIISLVLAIPVALLAAHHPRGIIDRSNIVVSMFGLSVPNFVMALILILIFTAKLKVLPGIGFTPLSQSISGNLRSMVLPSATLGLGLFCTYSRVLRADLQEQLETEDYIITARAKGVPPWRILIRHALRNSVFGLLTLIGINLGTLIGGTVLVEQIFALPGMGQALYQAISARDIEVVEALVTIMATAVVLASLLTDVLYSIIDPRVRYGPADS